MKRVLVLVAAFMAVVASAKAEVAFAYEAGAEIVSAYIWRGQYYFACFLPAGFPFCLILGQSRVFQKNARNYMVMSS